MSLLPLNELEKNLSADDDAGDPPFSVLEYLGYLAVLAAPLLAIWWKGTH